MLQSKNGHNIQPSLTVSVYRNSPQHGSGEAECHKVENNDAKVRVGEESSEPQQEETDEGGHRHHQHCTQEPRPPGQGRTQTHDLQCL